VAATLPRTACVHIETAIASANVLPGGNPSFANASGGASWANKRAHSEKNPPPEAIQMHQCLALI